MTEKEIPEHLWDRWPDEDSLWFDRFDTFYRSQGPGRTLVDAYRTWYREQHGKLPSRAGVIPSWADKSNEWQWKKRAEAWDVHLRKQKLREEEELAVDMHKEHVQMAQAVRNLAFSKMLEDGFRDAATALRAWGKAIQIEKGAMGVPDYIAEIAEMDEDELNAELAKALKRAGAVGGTGFDPETEGTTPSESEGSE
jgi:hypothetical protein